MYVNEGGPGFGFCPGKATWSRGATSLFQLMVACAETGALYESGGLGDQPAWFVDLLAWFLPRYNDLRFYSRAKSILGDGKDNKPVGPNGAPPRRK